MKKPIQILIVFILLLTHMIPNQSLQAETFQTMSQEELSQAKKLINYNILLKNHHSANQADVEGPLAVQQDSNFGKDTSEFSYGAIFNSDANTIGSLPTDDELISLLIGGKVNRIGGGNYELTMDYHKKNGKVKGRFVASENSINDSKTAFKENLKTEQIFATDDIEAIFSSLFRQNEQISRKLNRYSNTASKFVGETLGETWVDGRLVTYEMYESDVDDKTLLINILPNHHEGQLETIIHSFGIPKDYSDRNVVVTSFIRNDKGDRIHSEKIAFKGNFLSESNGSLHVANDQDRKDMAGKITYYFPQATQVTNFFDQKDYRTFLNPTDINSNDQGVDTDGAFQYSAVYLKNYATGNNNNGSAASGGGSEIIGSVIAPQATIVLTGSSINGFVSAYNLHQRNGAEIHNFRPHWIFDEDESLKSIKMKKIDDQGNLITSETACFALFRQAQGGKQYYNLQDDQVNWVTRDEAELKTIENGTAEFTNLKPGTYYIEERLAPVDYQLAEPLKVVVKDDKVETITVEFVNQKELSLKHKLTFRKVNSENQTTLEGAEFILVKRVNDVPYYYVEYKDFVSWLPNIIFAKRFITTNEATTIENLDEGNYELWELKAPSGHVINQHITQIELNEDVEIDIENTNLNPWGPQEGPQGKITVKKHEQNKSTETGLAGAVFILKGTNKDNQEMYVSDYPISENTWTKNQSEAYQFTTNEQGELSIESLNLGHYVLMEIEAPQGYEMSEKEIEFELYQTLNEQTVHYHFNIPNEKSVGSLKIEKVEKDREAHKLFGAEFLIYKTIDNEKHYFTKDMTFSTDENEAYVATTSIEGIAHIEDIPYGNYYLHEKKAPNGFKPLIKDDLAFTVNRDVKKVELKVENERKTWPELLDSGRLEIDKRSGHEHKTKLSGAEFILKHQDFGYFTGKNPLFSQDINEAKTVMTDAEGKAAFNTVPVGDYLLIETKAPEGYEKLKNPLAVKIESSSTVHATYILVKNYVEIPLGSLEIVKVDAQNQNDVLAGAQFLLLKDGRYYAGPDQEFKKDRNDAFVLETNSDGKISVEALAFGDYILEEIKSPDGYKLLEKPIEITLDFDKHENHHLIMVENQRDEIELLHGELLIIKEDAKSKERLSGAEFVIKQNERYLSENKNEPWTDSIEKALHLKTDQQGQAYYSGLEFGSYELKEVKSPKGYELLEADIPFVINGENPTHLTRLIVKNKLIDTPIIEPHDGTLKIIKVDHRDHDLKLPGASFILKRNDTYYLGNQLFGKNIKEAMVIETNHKGEAIVEHLPFGTYELEEIKAPQGYQLSTLNQKIEINKNENVIMVENIKNPNETIPSTGQGNELMIIAGLLVLVGTVLLLFKRK